MKIIKIEDLPNRCNDLKRALYAIITYEKLANDNFYYNIFDYDFQWTFIVSNMKEPLIIPKNIGKHVCSFIKFNKIDIISHVQFLKDIDKLNIIVDGLKNKRSNTCNFIFVKQFDFYEFYILCKKYGVII